MFNNKIKSLRLSYVVLFVILFFISFLLILKVITRIQVLDDGNLLIHEAGHLVFSPFGEFVSLLGGTILQLLTPILFLIYFLLKTDYLGISFSIFWVGENLINVSYYISDAQVQVLPLVGGGIHDWNNILSDLGILQYTNTLGIVVFYLGVLVLISSLASIVLFNFFRTSN